MPKAQRAGQRHRDPLFASNRDPSGTTWAYPRSAQEGPARVAVGCEHRAAIPGKQLGAFSGNMDDIKTLKLVCADCGGRVYKAFVVPREDYVTRFLDGERLDALKNLEA